MNYLRKLVAPVGESSLRWHSLLSFSSLPTPPGADLFKGKLGYFGHSIAESNFNSKTKYTN